jgi:hypothetical protein
MYNLLSKVDKNKDLLLTFATTVGVDVKLSLIKSFNKSFKFFLSRIIVTLTLFLQRASMSKLDSMNISHIKTSFPSCAREPIPAEVL